MHTFETMTKPSIGYSVVPDEQIFKTERANGAHHYSRLELVVRKTEGVWLTSIDGQQYLDCLAAYSAANPGHHHPKIVRAMVEALQGNYASVISNVVYTDALALFLEKLSTFVPQLGLRFGNNGNKSLLKNGGVESCETAIKCARYFGWKEKGITDGKQEIIVFENNFHGRMITTVSYSSSEKYRQGFGPLTPGFVRVPYGDLSAVEKAITKNTCAIWVEPMQAEGGMYVPPPGFLKGLRDLCDKHNMLLLFDEIQVALGRTGKMFCFEHENVIPDGITLGKALSGGLVPVSAFVTNSKLMDMVFQPGREGSTYGGYPLACVAGIAALHVIADEDLVERSTQKGATLKKRILDIAQRSSKVKEVRGRGLFIGIEVNDGDAMAYCRKLLNLGMVCNDSHGHTLRVSPPLIVDDSHLDYICERLEKVLV